MRVTDLPFIYHTKTTSFYEKVERGKLPIKELPKIPKQQSHVLPAPDIALLEDYRKAYLEGVRQVTQTTKDNTGTKPLYAYQKPAPEPIVVDFQAIFDETYTPEKTVQYEKGTVVIFMDRGVMKCGILQDHCYEEDEEICLMVYKPNEQNMLTLDPQIRKNVDSDHLQYKLDVYNKTEEDSLILSEEQYNEIYGCKPHLDIENEVETEDVEMQITDYASNSNFKTQTILSKTREDQNDQNPRAFA